MDDRRVAQTFDRAPFVEELITELETTEGRAVTSAAIVLGALVVGLVVVPFVVRITASVLRARILPDGVVDIVDVLNAYIPTTVAGLTVRLVQLCVLFVASLALLITWGMVDIAVVAVTVFWSSLPFAGQIVVTVLVIVFVFIGMHSLDEAIKQFSENADRITDHQEEIMIRVGHLSVLLIGVTGLLTLWGFNLSGLLVGAGALSVVVGLGARKTIGRMIAGFVLMFTRPFSIGDWVEIGDGHEGIVTDITIMHTNLRGLDDEVFIIPNDVVSEQPIRNLNRRDRLRLRAEVSIDYDDDPKHAETVALEAIECIDEIMQTPKPTAISTAFGDSAVRLELWFWIADPTPGDKVAATDAVIHAVKERFAQEGIKIPFPQRELTTRDETRAFRMAETPDEATEPRPSTEPESGDETNSSGTQTEN